MTLLATLSVCPSVLLTPVGPCDVTLHMLAPTPCLSASSLWFSALSIHLYIVSPTLGVGVGVSLMLNEQACLSKTLGL